MRLKSGEKGASGALLVRQCLDSSWHWSAQFLPVPTFGWHCSFPVPASATSSPGTAVPSVSAPALTAAPLSSAGGTVCIVDPDQRPARYAVVAANYLAMIDYQRVRPKTAKRGGFGRCMYVCMAAGGAWRWSPTGAEFYSCADASCVRLVARLKECKDVLECS